MKRILEKYSWYKNYKNRKGTLSIVVVAFILSAIIVYLTGGTKNSYLHIVYIPIIISAYFYKGWGGFLAGITAGIILGPFMPINTETMLMQPFVNWSFRMMFFVLIGTFVGKLFYHLEQQLNKVNKVAYFNEETKLPNKKSLRKDINRKIENKESFHIIVLSIKNYNDIYKLVGSKNFSEFILKLTKHISYYKDINRKLYYLNDSKFALYIDKLDKDTLINKLRRFNDFLNSPVNFRDISIFTDIIMSISTYPDHGSSFDEVIEKNFLALDEVKRKRRNFWIYESTELEIEYNKIDLLGDMNQALKEDQFELCYQPKINLRTNKVEEFEALIRWNHPQKGYITPSEFIHEVEKSSLIEPLTNWVIKKSINDAKEFELSDNHLDIKIAVNVSARNFQYPNFVEELIDQLNSLNVNPNNFAIEITETDLMIEMEENIDKLNKLREKGINLYLYYFGKEYSSLKYINDMPIDFIKIDKFFIDDLEKNQTKQDIVLSMIKMSHALNIKVVAEGVEEEGQLNYLKKFNCDYAQGYYFVVPDTKEKIFEWARKFNNSPEEVHL